METTLLSILLILNIIMLLMVIFLISKSTSNGNGRLENQISNLSREQNRLEQSIKNEIAQNREEGIRNSKLDRQEVSSTLKQFNESLLTQMKLIADLQRNQLDTFSNQLIKLTETNEISLNKMRDTVEQKLKDMQSDNNQKLDQMRVTVDEKLHSTLEKRLGESFNTISQRLEALYKELGEVQLLANGVNDLRKALTNVKTRGTWGEIQLGNIIEEILTKDQYSSNVATKKGSNDRVEFAIKLPGNDDSNKSVWLPIDAKFPHEDYLRLLDAQDNGNKAAMEEASKQLEIRIKSEARDIKDKYIDPPNTTDFGIMFLPTESLYAEVIRRTGLWETLQRDYKVVITGPSTLAALLNSLQMGFRTLAIEKRSSEVWSLLGTVKTEFGKFGDILDKTQKKLQEASNSIDTAARKSRTIERKLRNVQELPKADEDIPEDIFEIDENDTTKNE